MQINSKHHWAFVSLTRFLLALIVLSGHIYCQIKGGRGSDWTYFGLWFNQGSAVFGFLLLSGYSIAASVERSAEGFYQRRVLRIWPVYLFSLAFGLTVTAAIGQGSASLVQMLASLLMLQSIVAAPIPVDGQLWTLAVEWWLYMTAPALKKLPAWSITLLAISSLSLNIILKPADASKLLHGEPLLCLAWYWLAGFLYYRYRRAVLSYLVLALPIVVVTFSGAFVGRAVWIGVFALALNQPIKMPEKLIVIMTWLGDLSYPLYCIHGPVLALCIFWHVSSSWLICAIVFGASAAVLQLLDLPIRQYQPKMKQWLPFGIHA